MSGINGYPSFNPYASGAGLGGVNGVGGGNSTQEQAEVTKQLQIDAMKLTNEAKYDTNFKEAAAARR